MIRFRPAAHRRRGFTLIDIMIALVIIAILTSLAYPSYLNQVRKSKRAVAKSALLDAADRQEQFFFTHRGYADAMNKTDRPPPTKMGRSTR